MGMALLHQDVILQNSNIIRQLLCIVLSMQTNVFQEANVDQGN